jgi:hypothetical protein
MLSNNHGGKMALAIPTHREDAHFRGSDPDRLSVSKTNRIRGVLAWWTV